MMSRTGTETGTSTALRDLADHPPGTPVTIHYNSAMANTDGTQFSGELHRTDDSDGSLTVYLAPMDGGTPYRRLHQPDGGELTVQTPHGRGGEHNWRRVSSPIGTPTITIGTPSDGDE